MAITIVYNNRIANVKFTRRIHAWASGIDFYLSPPFPGTPYSRGVLSMNVQYGLPMTTGNKASSAKITRNI